MMKITIAFLILVSTVHAQPDTLWGGYYGGRHRQYLRATTLTTDSGFIMGGYGINQYGRSNYFTIKASADGDSLWGAELGGERDDYGRGECELSDGGYVIVGYKNSYEVVSSIGLATKFSQNGDSLWTHYYGGEESDNLHDVVATGDGGFVAAGFTPSFGNGTDNGWVIKAGSEGEVEWQKIYGGNGNDLVFSIILTFDGGYAIAGYSSSYGGGRSDFYLVKID